MEPVPNQHSSNRRGVIRFHFPTWMNRCFHWKRKSNQTLLVAPVVNQRILSSKKGRGFWELSAARLSCIPSCFERFIWKPAENPRFKRRLLHNLVMSFNCVRILTVDLNLNDNDLFLEGLCWFQKKPFHDKKSHCHFGYRLIPSSWVHSTLQRFPSYPEMVVRTYPGGTFHSNEPFEINMVKQERSGMVQQ